jgi:hypothetical protein
MQISSGDRGADRSSRVHRCAGEPPTEKRIEPDRAAYRDRRSGPDRAGIGGDGHDHEHQEGGQDHLVDGGAADAIPYERAFEKGCDRVIVILTRERSYLRNPEKLQPLIDARYRAYPNFCDTMRRRAETYNECRRNLFSLEREGKILLIAPGATMGFSRTERDVGKIRKLYDAGYYVTKSRMDEIKRFFPLKQNACGDSRRHFVTSQSDCRLHPYAGTFQLLAGRCY